METSQIQLASPKVEIKKIKLMLLKRKSIASQGFKIEAVIILSLKFLKKLMKKSTRKMRLMSFKGIQEKTSFYL